MSTYNISREGEILRVGFGTPAENNQIVQDAAKALEAVDLTGGGLIKINGPASLPVAVVIAHAIAHLFSAVAVFDPKLGKYVVSVTHDAKYQLGDLVD